MADLLLMIDSLVESENETTDLFLGHVAERSISRGLFAAAFLQTLSSYLPYFQQEAWEINDKLIYQK
jgi:hypothetical protein